MASVFTRERSPFFWIKYRDPFSGRQVRESTGIRVDSPSGAKMAARRCADAHVKELSAPAIKTGERWEAWAADYFDKRYGQTPSAQSARVSLSDLLVFCKENGVSIPRLLTYSLAARFIEWRKSDACPLGAVKHNTARLRLTFFSILMSEAVRRGFADTNPFREVRVRKAPCREKLEITHNDQLKIEELLGSSESWMGELWLVLMRQGCRLNEARVPLDRIDERARVITFKIKGGRMHSAPMHPDLLPLVARARAERRATLVEPRVACVSAAFGQWFKAHGFPYSPHCTRVTVITRLLRAGHSPAKVSVLIGHTETINVIYRRLKPDDARELLDSLSGTAASREKLATV